MGDFSQVSKWGEKTSFATTCIAVKHCTKLMPLLTACITHWSIDLPVKENLKLESKCTCYITFNVFLRIYINSPPHINSPRFTVRIRLWVKCPDGSGFSSGQNLSAPAAPARRTGAHSSIRGPKIRCQPQGSLTLAWIFDLRRKFFGGEVFER